MSISDHVPSPRLFHGPLAEARCREAATAWGFLSRDISPEKGQRGISIDALRTLVALVAEGHAGDGEGSVMVGPLDYLGASGNDDVLLKCLEEAKPGWLRMFLWATDGGSVSSTIRSRCLLEWCPGQVVVDPRADEIAKRILAGALSKNKVEVVSALMEIQKDWKDLGEQVVECMTRRLAERRGDDHLNLWVRFREVLMLRDVTLGDVLVAVMP